MIREAFKKRFLKDSECNQFPGGRAIRVNTAAVSLFYVSLPTSYGSRWKWATTVPFRKYCCFGRSSSQHLHRETTKIQGWSLRVSDLISLLLNKKNLVRKTEHKIGVLEACLTA